MATPERLPAPDEPGEVVDFEVEKRRKGKIIKGAISLIRVIEPFSLEEVTERQSQGLSTPLDLMPIDYWSPKDLPFPRFGEEMLGSDF